MVRVRVLRNLGSKTPHLVPNRIIEVSGEEARKLCAGAKPLAVLVDPSPVKVQPKPLTPEATIGSPESQPVAKDKPAGNVSRRK